MFIQDKKIAVSCPDAVNRDCDLYLTDFKGSRESLRGCLKEEWRLASPLMISTELVEAVSGSGSTSIEFDVLGRFGSDCVCRGGKDQMRCGLLNAGASVSVAT